MLQTPNPEMIFRTCFVLFLEATDQSMLSLSLV